MEETKQFVLNKITSGLLKKGPKYEECDDYDKFINSDLVKCYSV